MYRITLGKEYYHKKFYYVDKEGKHIDAGSITFPMKFVNWPITNTKGEVK